MFGYSIPLNFNKEGDQHTTAIGGCLSVFLKIAIGFYIYLMFSKMTSYGDDDTSQSSKKLDLGAVGGVEQN